MRYRNVGLLEYDRERATPGYTLIVPLSGKAAYLIGMRGEVLHEWSFPLTPGNYAYLLPNGNLLWSGRTDPAGAGSGGARKAQAHYPRLETSYPEENQARPGRVAAGGP